MFAISTVAKSPTLGVSCCCPEILMLSLNLCSGVKLDGQREHVLRAWHLSVRAIFPPVPPWEVFLATSSLTLVPWVLPALPYSPSPQTAAALCPGKDLSAVCGGLGSQPVASQGQGPAVVAVPTPGWQHCSSFSGRLAGASLSLIQIPGTSWHRGCGTLGVAYLL